MPPSPEIADTRGTVGMHEILLEQAEQEKTYSHKDWRKDRQKVQKVIEETIETEEIEEVEEEVDSATSHQVLEVLVDLVVVVAEVLAAVALAEVGNTYIKKYQITQKPLYWGFCV